MKIDTHVHSSGISKCSKISYQQIAKQKLAKGINGAILMNHCQPWYYEPANQAEWIENFIEEFEVSVGNPRWADFLIFGVTEDFLRNAPDLCRISQKELYEYCQKHGALLVQAHPLRPNFELMNVDYLDGVELNLSHSDSSTHSQVEELAEKHSLAITVGSDYHGPTEHDVGGIIIPDEITNSVELCRYLKESKQITTFIGEKITVRRGFAK